MNKDWILLWSEFPKLKFEYNFESFPKNDATPGSLMAWAVMLKNEIKLISKDDFSREALSKITEFKVEFHQEFKVLRHEDKVIISTALENKDFDPTQLRLSLNKVL